MVEMFKNHYNGVKFLSHKKQANLSEAECGFGGGAELLIADDVLFATPDWR
jgi:hypothetical protein